MKTIFKWFLVLINLPGYGLFCYRAKKHINLLEKQALLLVGKAQILYKTYPTHEATTEPAQLDSDMKDVPGMYNKVNDASQNFVYMRKLYKAKEFSNFLCNPRRYREVWKEYKTAYPLKP